MPKKTVNYFYKKIMKEIEKKNYDSHYEECKKDENEKRNFIKLINALNKLYNLNWEDIKEETRVKYISELQNLDDDYLNLLCERCMNDKELFNIVYTTHICLMNIIRKLIISMN